MSHWVCGPSATSVQVLTASKKVESASGSVSTSASKLAGQSAIVQNAGAKTSAGAAAQSLPSQSNGASVAVKTGVSTGAAAMPTAGAMVGVVGVVGALAVFL